MFKVKTGVTPDIMKEIVETDNRNYNFQHDFLIKRHSVRLVNNGKETDSFTGPKI